MKLYSKILTLGITAIASLGLYSCNDFLDEPSRTNLTEEQIYGNVETAGKSLEGLFKNWRDLWAGHNFYLMAVGTDEMQQGALQALKEDGGRSGAIDRFDAVLTSDLQFVNWMWSWRWDKISEAAKLVNALDSKKDEDATAAQYFGEASFIRGSLLMDMTMIFGEIPIIDIPNSATLGNGRQDLNTVWTYIFNDLSNATKYCPEKNVPGRLTSYAAHMLLGYAYMAAPEETGMRSFAKAEESLRVVVEGPFSLVPFYDLFDYSMPNTSEAIFEFQFANAWPDNHGNQFMIGSRAAQNMAKGDGCYFSGYDHALPTKWAYSNVEDGGIWEEGDIRKEESIRYEFVWDNGQDAYEFLFGQKTADGEWYNPLGWEGLDREDQDECDPHLKKYEDYRTDIHSGFGYNNMWNAGKNIPWLRLGNAYLLYAECLNELDRQGEALTWVNDVRYRAWEFDLPADKEWKAMSKEEFREQIMTERVRELIGERWRKFDLVRTGKFLEYVKERNKWAKRSGTIQPFNVRWPIPLSEIEQNDDISPEDQNEGYH